jgi:hypothetical protein
MEVKPMTFARLKWKMQCAVILVAMIVFNWAGEAFDVARIGPHVETDLYAATTVRVEPSVYTTNVSSGSVSWNSSESNWR